MGRGSKNIKNRRAKVSRKAKSNRTKFKTMKFLDENVRKMWDKTLTKDQNYQRLGLVSDPNRASISAMNPRAKKNAVPLIEPKKLEEVDFVDITAYLRDPNLDYTGKSKYHLPPVTREYFQKLIDKYGNDYDKMAKDTKANPKQHTKRVCQKQCEKLINLKKEEEAAEKSTPEAADDQDTEE